jgi:REP element-mobilizing transposase RayT
MEIHSRKKLDHRVPQWVKPSSFFFITICCRPRRRNQLCPSGTADRLLENAAFYHERFRWQCLVFLLMPDHLHAILAFPASPGMASTVKAWKSYQARSIGIDWQSGFFDHRLRDRFSLDEKLCYVLQNPVRAGLVAKPEDWPFVFRPADRPIWQGFE